MLLELSIWTSFLGYRPVLKSSYSSNASSGAFPALFFQEFPEEMWKYIFSIVWQHNTGNYMDLKDAGKLHLSQHFHFQKILVFLRKRFFFSSGEFWYGCNLYSALSTERQPQDCWCILFFFFIFLLTFNLSLI